MPAGSPTTTLVDVLIGSIDGVPVLIGDRIRRRPLTADPVQTVWLVALPQTLPFVSRDASFDVFGREVLDTAPNPEVAATMLAHGRVAPALPVWWIEDRYLYAVSHGDRRTTLGFATAATGFAAGLPWDGLRRFALPTRS